MVKRSKEQIRLEKICNVLKGVKTSQWQQDEVDYNYYVIKNGLKFGMTGTFADESQVEDISLYVMDQETGKVIESYENIRPTHLVNVYETLAKEEAENKEMDTESRARARLNDLLDD